MSPSIPKIKQMGYTKNQRRDRLYVATQLDHAQGSIRHALINLESHLAQLRTKIQKLKDAEKDAPDLEVAVSVGETDVANLKDMLTQLFDTSTKYSNS